MASTLRPYWAEATGDHASVVQAVPDMLEIVPSGTSKGRGVRMLLDHLGAPPSEVYSNIFLSNFSFSVTLIIMELVQCLPKNKFIDVLDAYNFEKWKGLWP